VQQGTVPISSEFEPERIVVDPDLELLQIRRKLAIPRFQPASLVAGIR